ncbi:FadR/GntR family transcriptional regulator [Mucilaginibacter sp. OK098]|uniref:FadR/GntR family transcriptional regulator n=1 Tax=Mucilaginibacter sp. OK098 TaxID=1855297 RepID=UPI00091AB52F|nr:GntR family transcriptional regulator [Mucilaginibacter sp. OK098]SHM93936.1 DNA-binding transcriptional regulator, FadR family [Mucilaginibacter sp. OK098]
MTNIIKRKNLSELVADQLLDGITSGHYKSAQKLPVEKDLMKIFGVGRSTIREAIKSLANSRYVNVFQGRGTFVATEQQQENFLMAAILGADTSSVQEIMSLLETKIIQNATLETSRIDLSSLKKLLENCAEAVSEVNLKALVIGHFDFYQALGKIGPNRVLIELYNLFVNKIKNDIYLSEQVLDSFQLLPDVYSGIINSLINRNRTLTVDFHCKVASIFYDSALWS